MTFFLLLYIVVCVHPTPNQKQNELFHPEKSLNFNVFNPAHGSNLVKVL